MSAAGNSLPESSGTLDEAAFEAGLLALNAAFEAARAGDREAAGVVVGMHDIARHCDAAPLSPVRGGGIGPLVREILAMHDRMPVIGAARDGDGRPSPAGPEPSPPGGRPMVERRSPDRPWYGKTGKKTPPLRPGAGYHGSKDKG